MGVTVQSHCVESFENLLQRHVGEGWVAIDTEKTQFFLNTLYLCYISLNSGRGCIPKSRGIWRLYPPPPLHAYAMHDGMHTRRSKILERSADLIKIGGQSRKFMKQSNKVTRWFFKNLLPVFYPHNPCLVESMLINFKHLVVLSYLLFNHLKSLILLEA